jgi:Tfp pilus assembly protein PilO
MSFIAALRDFFARRPYAALLTVLIVALLAGNYFLWHARGAALARHLEARQDGDRMLQALAAYPRIKSDLAAVDQALQVIDRSVLQERALEVNLGYFYQQEVTSRVRLRQLNQLVAMPAENRGFKLIPFSLQATGSYYQLIHFLHDLETGPRLMRIRNYSLERADARTNAMRLDLTAESLGHP